MEYFDAFEQETSLISAYGKEKAFVVWTMGLFLDTSDLVQLATESLTDGGDDKKIDFIRYDEDDEKLYIVQGTLSAKTKESAKASKASDLNTATAWLTIGDINKFPLPLKTIVQTVRDAISDDKLSQIELIFVHNCGESKEVAEELKTAANHMADVLKAHSIEVLYRELGNQSLERLYLRQQANIVIDDIVECPFKAKYEENAGEWNSAVLTVTGDWLRSMFIQYHESLFSANYRGFLGLSRKRINTGIKISAERTPANFWAYNNGVTILTTHYEVKSDKTILHGISVINGAQTTGSLGNLPLTVSLGEVKIMARVIECFKPELVGEIVKYNNTQNRIQAWDSYGNDSIQTQLSEEFKKLNYTYNYKRGFESRNSILSIENCIQPLLAFIGKYKDANRSKTAIFESHTLYTDAFEKTKARHVLFVSCLNSAITRIKANNKEKIMSGAAVSETDNRLFEMLTPIKNKAFIISIIAEVLIKLYSDFSDKHDISFMPNWSDGNVKTYDELVIAITPLTNIVLSQIANYGKPNPLARYYNETSNVSEIASHIENMIAMVRNADSGIDNFITTFATIVSKG